jgi:hypothetical protein
MEGTVSGEAFGGRPRGVGVMAWRRRIAARGVLCLATGAVARLPFGIAEGLPGSGFTASWHGLFSVT